METVIEVNNLSKHYKSRGNKNFLSGLFDPQYKYSKAVDDISFSVKKGEAVAFLGPNGAGKTTTTKMLTGLIYPTSGQMKVLGFEPFERKKEFLKRIGLVMGNKSGLNWDLTASQGLWLMQNIYQISQKKFKERLDFMMKLLKVEGLEDIQVRKLSLGERMKFELIASLIHDPEILFLDEPTIGLDIVSKKNIRQFLREIQKNLKTTLILTSHDMDDIEKVCDRVILINKGKIVYDDTLHNLTNKYNHYRYVRFIFEGHVSEEHFKGKGEVVEKNNDSYLIKVPSEKLVELISYGASQFNLIDIHIESVPLEEMIEKMLWK
jgi:ABC-2 type transport system ATP-binding protein